MFSVAKFHSRLPFIQKRSASAIQNYLSRLRGLSPLKSANTESATINKARIVWVDCEMTGLEVDQHRLVEIACIVTEPNLEIVDEIGPICIKHPPEVMENMSGWCKNTFKENGLIERIEKEGIPEHDAESKVLEFLKKHVPWNKCPLAGNSVHMDRQFLAKYMPKVMTYLHYRIIDVSSIKELVKRWYPEEELDKIPQKKLVHLALDDIKESIEELRYYKEHFFQDPSPAQVAESEKNGEVERKL
ncbi:exonuclease domain-containing protein [Ditylenchus destructor]|uniref:Probable oligoribonuclease n=1 Tax=Ditylenchus destructor TaxID=166010 RepID=A0AAD4MSN1_9BILA|nr:exonuclease domain-containing protein [Ditylenchus destructor]